MKISCSRTLPVVLIFPLLLLSCNKDDVLVPSVSTGAVSNIAQTTAKGGGNITGDGGSDVTARGVCWSTSPAPTVDSDTTSDGSGTGLFSSDLTGLIPNTTYYVRAYAINSNGTGYGSEVSFRTTEITVPSILTGEIVDLTESSVSVIGIVSYDGGSPLTAKGLCWSTSPNPTTGDNKTNKGTGTGMFTSTIIGLQSTTTYYIRAYATNSVGTSYGREVSIRTYSGSVTDIDENTYPTIIIGTQEWMAKNLKTTKYNNGDPIPKVDDFSDWGNLTTGGRCGNSSVEKFDSIYGWYYNWYAVTDMRNICPAGWHVPSDAEWTVLTEFLGGTFAAGSKLKETGTIHWDAPNTDATNESGFRALPAAFRTNIAGNVLPGTMAFFWTSSEINPENAYNRVLSNTEASISRVDNPKISGFSVRCIKSQ